jgi:hypothetical protein
VNTSTAAPVPDTRAERYGFEYAALRAVPRVDRGDAVNVGVIVYCQKLDFLAASTRVEPDRLLALDPEADV